MNRPLRTLILAVLIVIPSLFLPNPVRATSSWQCDNTGRSCNLDNDYSPTNCILNTNGDNGSSVNGVGFGLALSTHGQFCDGTGFLSAYALAETSASTDANAYAWIGFTDTITIPNYGQTTTHLNLGLFYALFGYVYTAGFGTVISSSASLAAMFSLTGPGVNTGNMIQNGGQPWSSNCFSNALGQLQLWPPPVGYCYDTRSQTVNLSGNQSQFSLNNIQVQAGGSYSLIFMVQANATAHSNAFSDVYGGSCFNIDYKMERNHYGTFNLGCPPGSGNQEAPQTSCPSTMSSPCYYFRWYDTSYSIALTYSGTPDFSVSVGSSSRSSLLDDYYGATAPVQVQSINGFAGYVNLTYGASPSQSVTSPDVYLKDSSGNLIANGTSFWVSPTAALSLTLSVDPCSKSSTQTYCTNGYCASNPSSSTCGSNYQTTPPATPGPYLFQIEGISGGLTRETVLNLPILYYDFVVRNVASSYSSGTLTVNATVGNMGDISPLGYGFLGTWGETLSYYLDGTLRSTVNLCGNAAGSVYPDCRAGEMFNYVWKSATTSGLHNTTVTATETIVPAGTSTTYGSPTSIASDTQTGFVSSGCQTGTGCMNGAFQPYSQDGNWMDDCTGSSGQCGTLPGGLIGYTGWSGLNFPSSATVTITDVKVGPVHGEYEPGGDNGAVSPPQEIVTVGNGANDPGYYPYVYQCSAPCFGSGTPQDTQAWVDITSSQSWSTSAFNNLWIGYSCTISYAGIPYRGDCYLDYLPIQVTYSYVSPSVYGNYFDINLNNNKLDSDFRLVPQSMSSTVLATPSSSISTTVTVAGFPDFSGTVSISGSAPSGWGLSFNTTSISLNPSQHLNITATIAVPTSTPAGNYTVTVTGTGPFSTRSINMIVLVSGFQMSLNPMAVGEYCNPLGCPYSITTTSSLTVTSIGGFSGTVSLSYVAPSPSGGTSVTGSSSVFIRVGGTATVTLSATLPTHVYYHVCTKNCPVTTTFSTPAISTPVSATPSSTFSTSYAASCSYNGDIINVIMPIQLYAYGENESLY